ncbi:Autophagy protein 7, partial [Coemansia sp. RSA 2424]
MSSDPASPPILQFQPFSSAVEPEFWAALAHHKLHTAQLDTAACDVAGSFGCGRRHTVRNGELATSAIPTAAAMTTTVAVPARLRVTRLITTPGSEPPTDGSIAVTGRLLNTNTVEEFKRLDKGAVLRAGGAAVLAAIQSGRATADPALLWGFVAVSFADLKRYR